MPGNQRVSLNLVRQKKSEGRYAVEGNSNCTSVAVSKTMRANTTSMCEVWRLKKGLVRTKAQRWPGRPVKGLMGCIKEYGFES